MTFFGLAIIFGVVALLIARVVSPIVALVLVPAVGALVAGFSPDEITVFFNDGIRRVISVAVMFVFAITFFGVLQDAGLFRPIIGGLVRLTRGNVVAVAVGTAIAGSLAHLDGAGATTFLLTVPALLPLYKRLGMNPYLMLLLLATGAGIANMMPWAGPLGRAAAVTGIDVTELWRPLLIVQAVGIVLLVIGAAGLGLREQRRIAAGINAAAEPDSVLALDDTPGKAEQELLRPRLMWVNAALFAVVIVALVSGILPAAYIFMIGLSVALMINYPGVDAQMQRISAHAGSALTMGAIILAAGSFLGVLEGSGMLSAIAGDLVNVLPQGLIPSLHIVLGILGLPMELVLNTDAYYFGLLPVVLQVVAEYGVSPESAVYALVIGNIVGTFISPFSPALWLALGLAGLDMGRHIRYSLVFMWTISLLLLAFAWAIGLL